MKKLYFVIFFSFLISDKIFSQVIINEISSNNQSKYPDNDAEFKDWIELYNPSASPVNLTNYKLSDDALLPTKWQFPNVSIPANGYLTLYASGKNRNDLIDHWEAAVLESDVWKYTVPAASISNWNKPGFNDAAWSSGAGGIGFGDGDDATSISTSATSVFMRKTFTVTDLSAISALMLYMDCDDGFIAYLNGTEIARFNMNSESYSARAVQNLEAVMYSGGTPASYFIPPSSFSNVLTTGTNILAIQVHQGYPTGSTTDLSARPFLFFGLNNTSNDYRPLPAWVPELQKIFLHTNFSLSSDGEQMIFSNSSGTVLENITFPSLNADNTWGRYPNGSGTWSLLNPSTPNADNGSAVSYSDYINEAPVLSVAPGFYTSPQNVTCSCSDGTAEIRYTTDGSKPTSSSSLYTSAISISSTTVLRAGCFKAGFITKKTQTNTYFINDPGTTLPVFSISTHPGNLFNADTGMYIAGPNAQPSPPNYGANFWQDWEREVHVEYFDKNKVHRFEQDCGFKIFGGWSRMQNMKSVRLIPDDKYGKDKFEYPLFSGRPGVITYDQIHLRNGGNDFNYSHLRDQVNHRALSNSANILLNKTHIDYSEYEPVVVFLNGQYWGIHHMRERFNHGYFTSHHNVGQGEFEMLEMDGDVIKQNNAHFLNLVSFIENNDMTNPANYEQVKQWLDIENFADYFIAQTYHTNWDWPHNNIKYWRPTAGGKWRYLYYDTDFSFALFGGTGFGSLITSDELDRVIDDTRSPHSPMLKKLLTNTEFRNYFVNRYADLINTIYRPANYRATFDQLKGQLSPDMPRHFSKWPDNSGSVSNWDYECNNIKTWISGRPPYAKKYVKDQFLLTDTVNVTLNVNPAGAGVIKISTIIPNTYPWTGTYFNGVPVKITAIANPGYTFNNWSSSVIALGTPNASSISLNITTANTFTANFSSTSSVAKIAISEINYNSSSTQDAGNWLELYNYGNTPMDLSGWVFKDSKEYNNFVIPNGTIVSAGQRLVLVNDLAKFNAIHPSVSNKIGSFNFQLGNSGETLRLFDQHNRLYLSVTYNDKSPWPILADGFGTTLELSNVNEDYNDGSNWFDGCKGGSPGTAYIACPCASVSLGSDKLLCAEGGTVTLNSGITAGPGKQFTWYYNDEILNGVTTPSLTTSLTGKYRIVVDNLGCIKTDEAKILSNLNFDLGNDVSLCDPITKVLDSEINSPMVSFSWTKNGAPIPDANSSSLEVKTPGTYRLTTTASGCTAFFDEVIVTTQTAIPVDGSRVGSGTVDLGVTGSGTTYKWYENPIGGSSIATGTSFTTPVLTSSKTYYVQDESMFQGILGKADNTGSGFNMSFASDFNTYKFSMNASKEFILEAITVYATANTNVSIRVLNSSGTVLHSRTGIVPSAGLNRISLNWNIPAGTDYIVDAVNTVGGLYVNNTPGGWPYPYKLSNSQNEEIVSIKNFTSWATSFYPFFYKWEISSPSGSTCLRIPVTANIYDEPLSASITANGPVDLCDGQNVTLTANTGGGAYTHQWQKNGLDISGETSFSITVDQPGDYTVTNSDGVDFITSSPVAVTLTQAPSVADAGTDRFVCSNVILLEGNTPAVGTGEWTIENGTGLINDINDPTSEVSSLVYGSSTFKWTIRNGICPESTNEVTIFRYMEPGPADAGTDQHICSDIISMNALPSFTGTGTWTQINGSGNIVSVNDPATEVNTLATGTNRFVWSIENGTCPAVKDTVVIEVSGGVTIANAGSDQELCNLSSSSLNGNTALAGTGSWSTTGTGVIITDPSDPTSSVSNLTYGSNIFKWSITDGGCTTEDEVEIIVNENPSLSNAGTDQYITQSFGNLSGNAPLIGTGKWTQLSGTGFISDDSNPLTGVGGLAAGENTYKWDIENGNCPSTSDTVSVFVGSAPDPFTISGPDEVDPGNTYTYSVTPQSNATYTWTLPPGAILISGGNTNSIDVSFPPGTSGNLILKITTPFGETSDTLSISVLTSIVAGSFEGGYKFYPNPFAEEGNLKVVAEKNLPMQIKISDMQGVQVYKSDLHHTNEIIPLGKNLSEGIYIAEISFEDALLKIRIVKIK